MKSAGWVKIYACSWRVVLSDTGSWKENEMKKRKKKSSEEDRW